MEDPRKALPLTPASVSTVTKPSCTVPPKAVPTPVFHGSVCQLHRSTLTLLIFTCAASAAHGTRWRRRLPQR